jgi:hypothetical protein
MQDSSEENRQAKIEQFVRALAIEAARADHRASLVDHRKKPRKQVLVPPGLKGT